jgi:hypothetical protein
LGLNKHTPNRRVRAIGSGEIISFPRLGGLHPRYQRAAVALKTMVAFYIHFVFARC